MITLYVVAATMSDGSILNASAYIQGPTPEFTYSSSFKTQPNGFLFPGLTITEESPLVSVALEGVDLVFRVGSTHFTKLPYGQDFQEFRINILNSSGQECFIEDNTTQVHCRSVVDATVIQDPAAPPVPLMPSWVGLCFGVVLIFTTLRNKQQRQQ